jgi:hypothetical protein
MSRLFRRITRPLRRPPIGRRPSSAKARLLVRALEDRVVPTTYTVNVLTDNAPTGSGVGSGTAGDLRYCITAAANGDTVDATGISGTIALGSGLSIPHAITINGPGSGLLTVNGGYHGSVLTVQNPVSSFTMSGLTITGGRSTLYGGAGGGIFIGGTTTATISNSVITGCSSAGSGGGLEIGNGSLLLENSSITGNSAGSFGAGVCCSRYTTVTVQNCSIVGNTAHSQGGGVYGNVVTISNSTIANNSAGVGGGGITAGTATITGSTITGNTASPGVTIGGDFVLTGGGGLNGGSFSLDSTIVSGNMADNVPDIYASMVAAKNSAIGTLAGYTLTDLGGNLPVGTPLRLGPLTNVTGPGGTFAMVALGPGSPALYAGDPALNGTTDERGVPRPQVGATPAIGAYERVPVTPTGTAAAPNVTTAGGTTYQFTVTYRDVTAVQYASINGNSNAVSVTGYLHTSTVTPAVTFVSATPVSNAGLIVATYQFTVPGGAWTATDNGTWVITAQPNQVANTNSVTVPSGSVGQFTVALPETYTVTNTNDNGPGSLRQAILDANFDASDPSVIPADTVAFSNTTAGGATNFYDGTSHTIAWQSSVAHVLITDPVTIVGPGAARLTVTANGTDRVMTVNSVPGQTVSLSGLTLTGGIVNGPGGGIELVDGNLTVTNSVVTGNFAGLGGGGVYASLLAGTVTVSDSTISGNTAGSGGGVYAYLQRAGALLLTNCTLSGNKASGAGGALPGGGAISISAPVNNGTGLFHVTGCTLAGNSASGQGGGAIALFSLPLDTAITNSTIANNVAPTGGAILLKVGGGSANLVSVTSTTITGNTATAATNSSLHGGGGIAIWPFPYPPYTVLLESSIVAGNVSADGRPDLAATAGFTLTADHCLLGAADTVTLTTGSANNLTGTVANPLDSRLAPLTDNGGPTKTCPPLTGSPALNAGSNPAGLATDQRGLARVVGGTSDIGAYEYEPITVAGVQVNDGTAQRSEVRSLTVTFSGPVSFAGGNAAAAFQLQHVQTGDNVSLAAAVSTNGAGQTVVTLTFLPTTVNGINDTDPLSGSNGGQLSLADGRYQLRVLGTDVTDAALGWNLDGNGDGVPGGDYVTPAETTISTGGLHLYRLFGDATGDGIVDLSDLAAFRGAYNAGAGNPAYLASLDADNSGAVDLADLREFAKRMNHSVFT